MTIALLMTLCILGGIICCIFFLKPYLNKISTKPKKENSSGGFGNHATSAMFVGLCAAYIGSYVGDGVVNKNMMPIIVAIISAIIMALFEYLINKKNMKQLENFSLAASMLIAMIGAVMINTLM